MTIVDVDVYGGWWFWPRSLWHRLFGHTDANDKVYGADWIAWCCNDCRTGWTEVGGAI